jgi:multidrug efflux pump subunit AcrA (membrane-fusion protein)
VSVAIRRGSRCPIESVSGQDTFDKRSNVTVMLSKLAAAVCKTGEDVWFSGDTSDLAPQVEAALDAYVDESHTKAIAILPLTEPRDEEAKFAENSEPEPVRVIGALIVEQMVDSRTPEGFLQRVNVVRSHSSTALTNALEYEGLFLMPLWRFLGKGTKLFRGRTLPKTIAVIAAAVAFFSFLCFYQRTFNLEGDGKLRPKVRSYAWAEVDGEVEQVLVDHDNEVKKGQVLLVQDSLELDKEIVKVNGDINQSISQLKNTQRELDDSDELTEAERSKKQGEITELKVKIKSLQDQLALLRQKEERLKIRSPIDGRVVTWNVRDRLLNRPVTKGESLLEIADPSQAWELEMEMPEKRMGHLAKAKTLADQRGEKLPVTFFLATNPSQQFQGQVEEVERSAEVRGEEGNTVLIRISFDQALLRTVDPKVGAGATAKVACGTRAIGYVWFHDLVDFIRAKILFRIM